MGCFNPLAAYRGEVVDATTGKRPLFFGVRSQVGRGVGPQEEELLLPCGQCTGCRLERSRQWAMRCMNEASLYAENCFITLTYDEAHLPVGGSLDRSAFPKFMKRLRRRIEPRKVRFYHAGEYGDRFARPHYHAVLFGFDFVDKQFWTRRGDHPVWRSSLLEELWPFGQSELGSVTFESAAYVARYVMKKVTGAPAAAHYGDRVPEYTTMSRGGRGGLGGIGMPWLKEYMDEVYRSDSVVVRGREMRPPRFYDQALAMVNPSWAELVCSERKRKAVREVDAHRRLLVKEKVAKAKVNLSKRGLE